MAGLGPRRLAQFCTQLGIALEAGLPLPRALASLERRGVSGATRPAVARLSAEIAGGASFSQAVARQPHTFPPLMVNLIRAGETSGSLPEVLHRLGDHYALQRKIRNDFINRLIYPGIQVFLMIIVLSILAYVMATLTDGGSPTLAGLRVMATGFGIVGGIIALYFVTTRILAEYRVVQEVMLHMPIIGLVRRSLALAHFSWSMELLLKSGTNIRDTLRHSFDSTGNGAFTARRAEVDRAVVGGAKVHEALAATGLFPATYIEAISIAEESGSMEEGFGRVAREYFDRAEFAMKASSVALSWVVWVCVASIIIFYIFSFYLQYLTRIKSLMNS